MFEYPDEPHDRHELVNKPRPIIILPVAEMDSPGPKMEIQGIAM